MAGVSQGVLLSFTTALPRKEGFQKRAALFRQRAGINQGAVMTGGLPVKARSMKYGAAFFIESADNEPADAGEAYRGGAQGARLQRDVQIQIRDALRPGKTAGFALR